MDIHGNMVGKSNLKPGVAITEMAWNCERFNMEENGETQKGRSGKNGKLWKLGDGKSENCENVFFSDYPIYGSGNFTCTQPHGEPFPDGLLECTSSLRKR